MVWHAENLKITHIEPDVATNILDHLATNYGEMTNTRGKEHTYMGMGITYDDKNNVTISMKGYIEEAIEELPEEIKT